MPIPPVTLTQKLKALMGSAGTWKSSTSRSQRLNRRSGELISPVTRCFCAAYSDEDEAKEMQCSIDEDRDVVKQRSSPVDGAVMRTRPC